MNEIDPVRPLASEVDSAEDLQARLRRLRSRMAAEGRKSAVDALDRAIARAHGRRPRPTA